MAIKLTFNSHKGGVTKSTSTTNLAGALLRVYPESRILIVDTDGQANISTAFGMNTKDQEDSMYDVFMGTAKPEDLIMPIPVLEGRVDLIPATSDMDFLDFDFMNNNEERIKLGAFHAMKTNSSFYNNIPNMSEDEFLAAMDELVTDDLDYFNMLKGKFDVLDKQYDFILFDTPPEIKAITASVLAIVDEVIIPFEPEALSVEGVIHLLKRIGSIKIDHNPNLEIAGILPVKVDMRTNLHKQILEAMSIFAKNNGVHFFETFIPNSIKFATATATGVPATLADRRKKDFSSKYYDLIDELVEGGRLPKPPKK